MTASIIPIIFRNQGALLWCVVPESLLDYKDYMRWVLCEDTESIRNASFNPQSRKQFDVLSRQAWAHLLMQIIKVLVHLFIMTVQIMIIVIDTLKVLVLPRVINHVPEYLKEDIDNIRPLDRNLYCMPERVLLAWLTFHCKKQYETLLKATGTCI